MFSWAFASPNPMRYYCFFGSLPIGTFHFCSSQEPPLALQLCQPCHEPDDISGSLLCQTLVEKLENFFASTEHTAFYEPKKTRDLRLNTFTPYLNSPTDQTLQGTSSNHKKPLPGQTQRNTRVFVRILPNKFTVDTNGTRQNSQGQPQESWALLRRSQQRKNTHK